MSLGVRYEGTGANMNGTADVDGDRFWIEDIEGLDGMDTELQLADFHRDGSAFTKGRYPKRELVIKGHGAALGTLDYGSLRIRNKIESWFADYLWAERWLYVDMPSPGTSVQLKTRPGGKIHFDPPNGNVQAFEIPLTCADPRKYTQFQESIPLSGTMTLSNAGNFPTFIFATLSSTATDPYLRNTTLNNQIITLPGSIPSGSTVDFLARRTVKAGVGMQEMAARPRNWWYLLPGSNVIQTNATWSVQWRHAFR